MLYQNSDVWLLDEPTRGIDVGAKSDLYRLIGEAAAAGKAVVFVSSYLPELLAVSDRVAVMRRGELVAVRPAADWTPESAMAAAVGAETDSRSTPPLLEAPRPRPPRTVLVQHQVVLDTNVVYTALRSDRGLSFVLLRAALDGRLPIALTAPLWLEYQEVTLRPGANRYAEEEVREVLDALAKAAMWYDVWFRWPVLPDPADAKVLEAAVRSRAGFLLTYNLRDFPGVRVPNLTVCEPTTFVRDHRPDLLT